MIASLSPVDGIDTADCLGHCIDRKGLHTGGDKTKSVCDWLRPAIITMFSDFCLVGPVALPWPFVILVLR